MGISRIIANDGYQFLKTYLVSALIYWLLSIVFELAFALLEKRVSVYTEELSDVKKSIRHKNLIDFFIHPFLVC